MAATFVQKIADRSGAPYFAVTIDSIGDSSGLRRFVDRKPTRFSVGSADYRRLLRRRPQIAPEVSHPLGGLAEQSELTIELVDVDDQLTALFRSEARPQTRVTADVTASGSQITLASLTGITYNTTLLYIGREALMPTSLASGTTINVDRAQLGTDAQAHKAGRPVYLYPPSIYARRIRVKLGFDDEECDTSTENELGGGWSIDTIQLGRGLNSWVLRGRNKLKHLDRLVCRLLYRGTLSTPYTDPSQFNAQGLDARTGANQPHAHFGDRVFFQVGSNEISRVELLYASTGNQYQPFRLERRGVGGTRPAQWQAGDEVRQIYLADRDDSFGSFRYQAPGDETSDRTPANWTVSDHPVVILLAILTSWSSVAQTTPDNYVLNTSGNYSGLPPGVGLGVPIALLDYGSFLDVWQRTQNFRLPYFVLRGPVTGRKVIDQICRLCGFDMRVSNGKISLSYFRSPLAGEATLTWDDSKILTREGEGDREPIVEVSFDTEFTAGAVVFKAKTSLGADTESTFTDSSFPEFFGDADGSYESEDQHIEIDASAVRVDAGGSEPELLKQRALQLLYRYRRPLMRFQVATDLSQEGVEPGSVLLLTHEQVPHLADGTRGVEDLICRVLEKGALSVEEGNVSRSWTLIAYGAGGRFGRVSPSARMSGAPSSAGGGNYDFAVSSNRYTDPNARGGLPTNDATAFAVGDRVRLTSRGGNPIATTPAYQTVVSRSAGSLRLDGNFGGSGSAVAGAVLAYVGRDSTTTTQAARYVHMSDEATRTPGSTSESPWTYGEP